MQFGYILLQNSATKLWNDRSRFWFGFALNAVENLVFVHISQQSVPQELSLRTLLCYNFSWFCKVIFLRWHWNINEEKELTKKILHPIINDCLFFSNKIPMNFVIRGGIKTTFLITWLKYFTKKRLLKRFITGLFQQYNLEKYFTTYAILMSAVPSWEDSDTFTLSTEYLFDKRTFSFSREQIL